MKKTDIDISVLVLCYNASKYIEQCLSSIINQVTDYSIQLVVMDDCSQDDSFDKTLQFLNQHKRPNMSYLAFTQKQNKGCYANLIDGLTKCDGQIVAYIEADDYWIDFHKLNNQIVFLTNHNQYSGIGTGCQFVDENGNNTNQPYYTQSQVKLIAYRDAWSYPQFQTSSFVFENIYPLQYHPDLEFSECNDKILIEHLTRNKPVYYTPEKTTAYRVHQDNITSKRSKSNIFLHHLRVNAVLFRKTGIKNLHHLIYAFVKLTYIWMHDMIKSK